MRTTWSWLAVLLLACSSSDPSTAVSPGASGSGGQAGGGAGSSGEAGSGGAVAEQVTVPRLKDCLEACANKYPDGLVALGNHAKSCACSMCASACPGLCGDPDAGGTLDQACATSCFVAYVEMSGCDNQKYECNHDDTCQPYWKCASECVIPTNITAKTTLYQMRQACVDRINDYRAIEGVGPVLSRHENFEVCADGAATKDELLNKPHASFLDCGEKGQNECFLLGAQYGARTFLRCLEEMYMEKYTGVDNGGHYENMVRTVFTSVACGFSDQQAATQNFY